MDALDEKLFALLRHNARRSIADLALALKVSRATIRARMERMERAGDIIGYSAIGRGEGASDAVRAIMMVDVEGQATDRVIKALGGLTEVVNIYTTNGAWDLVVELGCADLQALDGVLRRIRLISGVIGSETTLLLSNVKSRRPGRMN